MDLEVLYQRGVVLELAIAAIAFPLLFWITVPYGGRHTSERWGVSVPAWLAWLVMEIPAPICFAVAWLQGDHAADPASLALAAGFLGHYAQRSLWQPLQLRGNGKRTPLSSASLAALVNVLNGTINGLAVGHVGARGSEWLVDPRFIAGTIVFLAGAGLNRSSDAILHRLRAPGESGYRIPRGGLYRWVSSPNYLGEIIQWGGWALATWSGAGLAFFVLTIANLAPRARSNHQWYRATFDDYPPERRALVPGIW